MPRDPKAYLWDAKAAADAIADFVSGRTFEQYKSGLRAKLESLLHDTPAAG